MAIKALALIGEKNNRKKKKETTPTIKKEVVKNDKGTTYINKSTISTKPSTQKSTQNRVVTNKERLTSNSTKNNQNKDIKTIKTNNKPKRSIQTVDVYERGGRYYYQDGKKEKEVDKKFVQNALKNNKSGVIGRYSYNGKLRETDENGNVKSAKGIRKEKVENLKTQLDALTNNRKNGKKSFSQKVTDVANVVDAATDFGPLKHYKNAYKTAGNIATNMGTGAMKTLENVMDTANDLTTEIDSMQNYWINRANGMSKKEAKKEREAERQANREWVARDLTNEFKDVTGYNKVKPQWEEGSLVKEENLGGQVAQGVGGMVPSLLVGQYANLGLTTAPTEGLTGAQKLATIGKNVGKSMLNQIGSNTVLGASSYGSGLEEAYREGAKGAQARLYGLGNAATELVTEWITGGIPGTKSEGVLDGIVDDLIDSKTAKLSNKYVKGVIRTVLKSNAKGIGEGIEEALADIINPHLKNLTYSNGEKVDWNQVKQSALSGYLIGMFLNSPETLDTLRQEINNSNVPPARKQALNNELTTLVEQTKQSVTENVQEQNQQEINPIMQQQANEVAQMVESGQIDAQEGNALLDQIKSGNYNQNRNLETLATQEYQRLQQDLQDGLIDSNEYTQNLNALNQTLQSERERINTPQSELKGELANVDVEIPGLENANQNNIENTNTNYEDMAADGTNEQLQQETELTKQLEKQGTKVLEEAESLRNGMIDNFKEYLEENNITNPTQEDINNSMIDALGYDYEGDYGSELKNEKLYNQYAREYMKENNIPFKENIPARTSENVISEEINKPTKNTQQEQTQKVETTGEEGIEYWEEQGADEKVAKVLSEKPKEPKKTIMEKIKEGKATLGDEIQQFNRKFVDKGETIYKLGKEKKNPSLYAKYDKMGTARAEAQYSIGNAQTDLNGKPFNNFTDENGNKVPMSLEQIFEGTDPQTINEYLAHWINVDRYQQVNKAGRELQEQLDNQVKNGVITRQEANEIWDGQNSGELHKYVFGPNVTDEDSRRIIAEMEEKDPNLKRVGGNVWQYGRNQLQNRVDAGVISENEAARFLKDNEHYVRLQRDVSEMNKGNVEFNKNGNARVNKQIQEFEGSTLDILPFKDSMANYTIKTMEEMRTNEFAKELAKTIGVGSTSDTINSIDEMFGVDYDLIKDNGDGTYSLTFFNNGTPTIIPINEGIYESLQPNKHFEYEDKMLFKGVRKFDNVRKALLTDKNPMFLATNMVKDLFDAPLNSKYPVAFAKNYPRAIKEIATNGEYFQQYQALGGLQNSYFEKGEFQKQGSKYNPLTWIEKGNNAIEQFPRLAEFISTMEKTGDVNQAMYNAAEVTTNFKRGGEITKSLNRNGATFLNASVQGFSKQIRNFTDIQSPRQATQMLAKVVVLGIAPGLLNDLLWDDDDEYQEMQDYQKDRYYLFKGKDGNWIRIPKGRAVSIFQSVARRTKNYLQGDKNAYKGLGELTANQVAPNNPFENNIISPIVDVARNKAWSGNQIVSDSIKNKKHPEEEYTTKTDEFSKWLGKKLKKSPAKINYLIDQYSGALGDITLPNITKNRKRDIENPFDLIANPFKDKFSTNAITSNKSQNEFYDTYEDAESDKKWSKSTPEDEARYKYLNSKNRQISEIRKSIYEMYDSNKSTEEKYKYNLEKQKEINKIAKEAVENSKNIKKTSDNEFVIGDEHFTIANGQVNKVNTSTTKEANKYGLSIGDYTEITSKYGSLKADKDSNGKSIAGSKKEKFIKYVNSRNDLTKKQKISIIKKYYKKYE